MMMRGEEKELWERVEPYLEHGKLRDDAPDEVKAAWDRLYEIAWVNPQQ